jgi:hypothetical protein
MVRLRGLLRWFGRPLRAFQRASGALLPEAFHCSLRDQPWQPEQVVGGAAEDEEPVDLGQSKHLHLSERAGLPRVVDQPSGAYLLPQIIPESRATQNCKADCHLVRGLAAMIPQFSIELPVKSPSR